MNHIPNRNTPRCFIYRKIIRAITFATVIFSTITVAAQDVFWNGGTGSWFIGNNWGGGSVPTAGNFVHINNGGTAQVFGSPARCSMLSLGDQPADVGSLNVASPFSFPAELFVAGTTLVGNQGTGVLSIASGAGVARISQGGDAFIAFQSGSSGTATVSGSNARWEIFGNLRVGLNGTGTLNVTNGATVNTINDAIIGEYRTEFSEGVGTATISGANSSWRTNNLTIGSSGNGNLDVNNGGFVRANGNVTVGNNSDSVGNVTISGASFSSANLTVGDRGIGNLYVNNGSFANVNNVNVGDNIGGVGTATISGINTRLDIHGNLSAGRFGTGNVTVEAGGRIETIGFPGESLTTTTGMLGTFSLGTGGTLSSHVVNNGVFNIQTGCPDAD